MGGMADSVDHYCRAKGIRLICVDRPGFGGTPNVPSEQRIEVSCRKSNLLLAIDSWRVK
jgi:hypothetical protein